MARCGRPPPHEGRTIRHGDLPRNRRRLFRNCRLRTRHGPPRARMTGYFSPSFGSAETLAAGGPNAWWLGLPIVSGLRASTGWSVPRLFSRPERGLPGRDVTPNGPPPPAERSRKTEVSFFIPGWAARPGKRGPLSPNTPAGLPFQWHTQGDSNPRPADLPRPHAGGSVFPTLGKTASGQPCTPALGRPPGPSTWLLLSTLGT